MSENLKCGVKKIKNTIEKAFLLCYNDGGSLSSLIYGNIKIKNCLRYLGAEWRFI